jgi:hypothetical protein
MQRAIELLTQAYDWICKATLENEDYCDCLSEALNIIDEAIAEIKAPPRWETPEQRKERTGEEWPDMNAVYVQAYRDFQGTEDWEPQHEWGATLYWEVKGRNFPIVCATEAGRPPDDWAPEVTQ